MPRVSRSLAALFTIAATIFLAAPTAQAAPPQHCAVVMERINPGQPELRVVDDFCTTTEARVQALVPAASYTLVTFYSQQNYGGASRSVWVPSPCDSVGYSISDNSARNAEVGGIRSLALGDAGCTFVQAFQNTNFTGSVQSAYGGLSKLGYPLYAHVWSAKMWQQGLPCLAAC